MPNNLPHKKTIEVFFDISIAQTEVGRVLFELYPDVAPKSVENFRALCSGEKGKTKNGKKLLCYKGSKIFRVSKNNFIQGGDILKNNGYTNLKM